jgi:polyferredoxin
MSKKYINSIIVFILSFGFLAIVQLVVDNPMILLERFIKGGGWIEIFLLSCFAVFLYLKMRNPNQTSKWRTISWTIFGIAFFLQLIIGIFLNENFLMSGKLHLPIPAIIVGGALYKLKLTFMPILLISTIVLTGPAWCSQFCYFGAFDNLAARTKKKSSAIKKIFKYRNSILLIFIVAVLILRLFEISINTAAIAGGAFGIVGLLLILILSPKKGSMINCVMYCPIGTIVSYLKFINPFRMYIDTNCDSCLKCTKHCRYIALTKEDVEKKKPGLSCTYCGDCITTCHTNSIKYKFLGLSSDKARNAYLIITISLFVVFLGVARI